MQTSMQPSSPVQNPGAILKAEDQSVQPSQRTSSEHSIGVILVKSGKLSPDKTEAVLNLQKKKNLRFGDAAIKLGLVSADDIRFALARQYHYPYLLQGDGTVSDELVAAYQPFSAQVETMRDLRSQLMARWFRGVQQHKTLAMVSPGNGEGRSYLAANMAIMFSQLGERTLLIDGDMRYPRQHHLFNLENQAGLSSILSGRSNATSIQHITSFSDLSVLTAGPTPPNPQELLGRPMFTSLMTYVAQEFDVVIIDTPAASKYADAAIIAMQSQGALIVTRQNTTRLRKTQQLANGLEELGVEMVGAVLNNY
jgi:protein-tyrosine kinase